MRAGSCRPVPISAAGSCRTAATHWVAGHSATDHPPDHHRTPRSWRTPTRRVSTSPSSAADPGSTERAAFAVMGLGELAELFGHTTGPQHERRVTDRVAPEAVAHTVDRAVERPPRRARRAACARRASVEVERELELELERHVGDEVADRDREQADLVLV